MLVTRSIRGRIAIVTIAALAASPITPLFATQTPAPAQAPAPTPAPTPTAQPAAAKPATKTPAAKPAAAPAAAPVPTDGDWPRSRTTASGALLVVYQPQIASWVDQKHVVAYAAVSYTPKGATEAGARHPQAGVRHQRGHRRTARELHEAQDHRVELSDARARSAADRRRRNHRGDAARRPGDRARPRAGQHRHQPDHPEERRRREGGSAADLLQQDAGDPRQHRRRSDLVADPAERSDVGGQHQLGSLPARADQDLLPPQRQGLAESHRREGTMDAGRHAAGELPEAAGRRQLEGRQGERCPARRSATARCRRCSSAWSRRS